jgi:hypothetical protein
MRRAFGYAGAWVAVTSGAVGVSWYGCAIVLNGSSSGPPSVLASVGSMPGSPLDQATTGPTKVARPEQTRKATSAAPRATAAPRASRSSSNRPFLPAATPTHTKHASPPPHRRKPLPPNSPTTTTVQSYSEDPTAVLQTYRTIGGTATLRFSPAEAVVQVVSLKAAPGYRTYIDQFRPDELVVIFARSGWESNLHATWDGEATAEVTEYSW